MRFIYKQKFPLKKENVHRYHFVISMLLIMAVCYGCVEDETPFPEENDTPIEFSPSVVTILSNLGRNGLLAAEELQCIQFQYPITLGYNTDSSIRIDDYEGLVAVIENQQANFNITGLSFPVEVTFKDSDSLQTLTDENDLFRIIDDCDFTSLREDIEDFSEDCFEFVFPITLRSEVGREQSIASEQALEGFIDNQNDTYQPDFVFPIRVEIAAGEVKTVSTYFELYEVMDTCGRACPQLAFTIEDSSPFELEYTFEADFPTIDVLDTYSWFIDGELVKEDGVTNQGDHILVHSFEAPATYEVCIQTTTADCATGAEFCKMVEVEEVCPELFFEAVRKPGTVPFVFTADFEGDDEIIYQLLIDGEFIANGGADMGNIFERVLEAGTHTVCIKATTVASCPQGVEFCKEIVYNPLCPDLFFSKELDPNGNDSYVFTASFVGIEETMYSWTVDGDPIEQDGGANGDNKFLFQFASGEYEICIKAETADCPEGAEFCEQIIVD